MLAITASLRLDSERLRVVLNTSLQLLALQHCSYDLLQPLNSLITDLIVHHQSSTQQSQSRLLVMRISPSEKVRRSRLRRRVVMTRSHRDGLPTAGWAKVLLKARSMGCETCHFLHNPDRSHERPHTVDVGGAKLMIDDRYAEVKSDGAQKREALLLAKRTSANHHLKMRAITHIITDESTTRCNHYFHLKYS